MKSNALRFALLLLVVAVVSVSSCWITNRLFSVHRHGDAHSAHSDHAHQWIHDQLGLTPEQEKLLEPIEKRYQEERRRQITLLQNLNKELAAALLQDKEKTQRIDLIVEKIHDAMGDLQKATLNHVFEMKSILRPEQSDKLLKLTAESLDEMSKD
ncbi:MAG: Spy/CpxP family protein refolding chaperone [Candidatus Methylacidiphilales bacterium]|nr:periplasmic heavy metal sensor [Candidatus Methylacidiphilales bacterium]